ncbi:DMT family transporter [Streptomyces sp. 891-h]|uniref:DMT family transporter n=1 Tax=unclassified Streptomyces TaxID=2593676 RepID=UPI001FAA246E|nr:DMT family transporter [Streptomyces sp. 891-h]UNZ20315.1 DMT family transporter [Streptomyces sp. 891-h]
MRANDSATPVTTIAAPAPETRICAPSGARGTAHSATSHPQSAADGQGQLLTGAPRSSRAGVVFAVLGVVLFSLTFPATSWSLEGFGPWSAASLRTLIAGLVAGGVLLVRRVPLPERRHWGGLALAASGVVIGFPLLTTLALQTSTTSHAAVVVGLLPLTTALYSSVRTGSRPAPLFWVAAVAGAAAVVAFALHQSGGAPGVGDLYLCGALLICAAGYAEGGRLARELPALEVIGWAVVCCLPVALVGAALALAHEPVTLTAHSVPGLVWGAVCSQFVGMFFWYRAMGLAGVARTSQVQLGQPLLTLVWAVLLVGERLTPAAPAAALAVLVCIVVVQRSRA